jgi:DNA-binding MarR family transcriptional regulator
MVERIGRKSGLDLPQHLYVVMTRVAFAGPVELRDVAAEIAVDNSTVSRWVRQLVSMGLIDSQASQTHRRRHILQLTPNGEAAWARLRGAWAAFFAEALAAWPADQLQSAHEVLSALVDATQSSLAFIPMEPSHDASTEKRDSEQTSPSWKRNPALRVEAWGGVRPVTSS